MKTVQIEYRLELFTGNKATDPDFIRSLSIYAQYTPVSERIDSNEIVYWLERYDQSCSPDRLLLFGLFVNSEMIGFAEVVWLSRQSIAILDYMTISDRYNRNSAFFNFLDLISSFLIENGMIYSYLATEILHEPDGAGPDEDSKLWVKLLRTQGFRSVEATYLQPPFGSERPETARRGRLMLLLRERSSQMKKDTYLWIVKNIYEMHYARWYAPLDSDHSKYAKILSELYKEIEVSLESNGVILVNGEKSLLPATNTQSTEIVPPKGWLFIGYSISTVLLLSGSIIFLSTISGSGTLLTLSILITSLIIYMIIISIFIPEANNHVERLMDFFKSVFGPKL